MKKTPVIGVKTLFLQGLLFCENAEKWLCNAKKQGVKHCINTLHLIWQKCRVLIQKCQCHFWTFLLLFLIGYSVSQITEMYYVKRDNSRLVGITDNFEIWVKKNTGHRKRCSVFGCNILNRKIFVYKW